MKKTMIITGIISITMFITGTLFKVMHWPGAGILLVLGMGFTSILFLPLLFILKTRDKGSLREKLIIGIGALIGILLCLATLFTIQHWPGGGNGVLWLAAIGLSVFVLIPVYFFTGIRNPENRSNTIITSIVLLGATGLLFSMVNLRPSRYSVQLKMHAYMDDENLLKKLQSSAQFSNEEAEINRLCTQLKQMIITGGFGQDHFPADFEEKKILMEEHSLGAQGFHENGGMNLLAELKKKVETYNSGTDAASRIPLEHSVFKVPVMKLGGYTNYTVLNSINQLQMHLAVK